MLATPSPVKPKSAAQARNEGRNEAGASAAGSAEAVMMRPYNKPMADASLMFDLPDSGATEALGAALARAFPGAASGAIVHLRGELGSGKTTCARRLLHTLGVTAPV